MALRLTLSAVAGGFYKAIIEGEKPIARAATVAVRESEATNTPRSSPNCTAKRRTMGQVYELLDILTGLASFEGRVLRPTIVSYS